MPSETSAPPRGRAIALVGALVLAAAGLGAAIGWLAHDSTPGECVTYESAGDWSRARIVLCDGYSPHLWFCGETMDNSSGCWETGGFEEVPTNE